MSIFKGKGFILGSMITLSMLITFNFVLSVPSRNPLIYLKVIKGSKGLNSLIDVLAIPFVIPFNLRELPHPTFNTDFVRAHFEHGLSALQCALRYSGGVGIFEDLLCP